MTTQDASPPNTLTQNLVTLVAGLLFGLGLGFSQMIDPQRVIGFLDLFGSWDPTLAFVMGGAVLVTLISFRVILRRPHPLLGNKFFVPTRSDIDRPLVLGAALFGIGWGLGGYCPGPAIAALSLGSANPVLFVVAMIAGSLAHKALSRPPQP
ncbi:YeeE/YedE family protein [Phormidium tenue]|uniref:YeeE/YedE family protein n=1 Tax=Phormidium tenue NIES-30 TaxID=549789 RepID=A0A1U7J7Z8_9CYAN|nr:YeeE/YedE family protein [Phormidium tenue]MBD2231413.1 YeeE/YedE family protein [Phormidium tenue FACHB-1052]OKH49187.1 YeeE/YedE family protein [Phormidium tenue NIES-30]